MSEDEMEDMIPAVKIKEEASIKVTETQASPSKWEVKTMAARKQSELPWLQCFLIALQFRLS